MTVFLIVIGNKLYMWCQDFWAAVMGLSANISAELSYESLLVFLLFPLSFFRFCFWLFIFPQNTECWISALWSHLVYLHLCDWCFLSQSRGFFEALGSGCSYYPAASGWPWHSCVMTDELRRRKGGHSSFVLRRVVSLWTALLLLQQNMSLKVAATRFDDSFFGVKS